MSDFSTLPPLKTVIDAHGLLARKSLGQHFLLDGGITARIAACAGNLKNHHVIEIGPGPGGLTRALLIAGAMKLYAVEKDDRCIPILEGLKKLAPEQLEIIHADALTVDLIKIVPAPRKIVANLPYNVGTELLLGWLDAMYRHGPQAFASLTLMFQKEVAERIVAAPGGKDYGRLSVLAQWLCDCRWDMDLAPGAFFPPPKVSSAVVTLTPRQAPLLDVDKTALEKVTAAAFGQRRKMLRQALKTLGGDAGKLLEAAGIDGTKRAEQLDVTTLARLAKAYQQMISLG